MNYHMNFRTDYKRCPLCGAVLDCGEKCDCSETSESLKDTSRESDNNYFAKAADVNLRKNTPLILT